MISFDQVYGHALARIVGCTFNPHADTTIARLHGDMIVGGMVYQDYTGCSISCHFGGTNPKWISRDLLWVGFHYPFEQLGCRKIVGGIRSSNVKALDVARKLGFKEETRIRDVYPGGDDAVFVIMEKEDCRWLDIKPRTLRQLDGFVQGRRAAAA